MINRALDILRTEGFATFFRRAVRYVNWTVSNYVIEKLSATERQNDYKMWEQNCGKFDSTDYQQHIMADLSNEAKFYFGEIVKWIKDIEPPPSRTLLAGDNCRVATRLSETVNLANIYTAGLMDEVNFHWDFENDPPSMGMFDLIVSQAMLEHLINPYKHIYDLVTLLNTDGYLIIHTVCPGYPYHRYPIDALRFFPDWFEEVAKRLNLTVIHRRIKNYRDNHIFYMYKKCQV